MLAIPDSLLENLILLATASLNSNTKKISVSTNEWEVTAYKVGLNLLRIDVKKEK